MLRHYGSVYAEPRKLTAESNAGTRVYDYTYSAKLKARGKCGGKMKEVKMKQEYYALITGALFILGAGMVETYPAITLLSIIGMAASIKAGRLWEVKK